MARKTYPGSLTRRGDAYFWRWQHQRQSYRRTFHTKDKNEAIHQVRKEIEKIEADRQRPAASTVTMRDLLDEFERYYLPNMSAGGADTYRDSLGLFRRYFVEEQGNPLVTAVKAPDVQRYVDWRRVTRRQGRRKVAPKEPVS